MLFIIFPITYIFFPKRIDIGSLSIPFIILPFAGVGIAKGIKISSFTIPLPIFPFPLILFPADDMAAAPAMEVIIDKPTNVCMAVIFMCKGSFSFSYIVLPLAFIGVSIGIDVLACPVAFTILEITGVIVSVLNHIPGRCIFLREPQRKKE